MNSSLTFQQACDKAKTLEKDPGNDVKLKMYALFKQATEGPCSQTKPSVFDMVGKAKWEAWNTLGSLSQDEAKSQYVSLINGLFDQKQQSEQSAEIQELKYEGIKLSVSGDITELRFNRPEKKNAITTKMYKDIALALKEASENDTAITILTGEGDYYSSGNDLSNFASVDQDISAAAKKAGQLLNEFVGAFIDFPKILVAAVNGPAVGIPVTLLGLCDVVYASDKATFQTPFSFLGQSPEACATYTFPKIMGYSKANEVLLFNKKFDAVEAKSMGLVSEIFPNDTFHEDVKRKLEFLSQASKQSMILSKELIRKFEKDTLHTVNDEECKLLVERWQSQDCMEALMRFFTRKSKL
ncbi:enoyl-CoA delta isomerase 2 isoform X2 [Parasteatoda tepidariorum]|nr:enoyl-CoA delta isomerase 2 isoform X2 [Parasteatoda tepidariorum]